MAYENWRVYVAFASQPDAVAPIYTEVTAYVDTVNEPITVQTGETPESATDYGTLTLKLRNADQRFTPGNVLSPHYPNIKSARKILVQETIADQVIDIFTGYIQFPEIDSWTESNTTTRRDQTITVTAVDRIARLARTRKFVSTLGAQIVGAGGTALKAYWPLNEPSGPTVYTSAGGAWTLSQATDKSVFGFTANDPVYPSISYASATAAPGDDVSGIVFQPSRDNTSTPPLMIDSIGLSGDRATAVTLSSGRVMTVVGWVAADAYRDAARPFHLDAPGIGSAFVAFNNSGVITASAAGNIWSGGATGVAFPLLTPPRPVAVRFGFDPAVIELWADGQVYTGVMSVTTGNPLAMKRMRVGLPHDGSVAHLQVYLGAAADWDHDDFLAQREVGLYGLARQSTGQRIRTIAQYAGIPGNELGRIDNGASVMQVAKLAGKTPIDAMNEAVQTEQGALYAAGDGQLVFADRLRIYNV